MQQIEVDFDVWKALTAKRTNASHDYNDVLRDMLGLPISEKPDADVASTVALGKRLGGRFLPNGSKMRATYKGALHFAEITEGQLRGNGGQVFSSASAAARAVTGTNVNGLTFWDFKRPGDSDWRKLSWHP